MRTRVAGLDLRPMALLQPRWGYTPDFLAPPPNGPQPVFADELARIAATPPERVHEEIARSVAYTRGGAESATGRLLLGEPAAVLAMLVELVADAWRLLIEPAWPRIRGLLDADIGHQSRRFAEGGIDRLFADLHPALSWHGNVLTRARGDDQHRDLGGEGVLLMPSAFKCDQVVVILDQPWQPSVVYPARGLGTLWQPASGTGDAALAKLIGRTRAELLAGLTAPASTMVLAHRLALATGTVSEHLGVLRDAGLVEGERVRHEVRYCRTALGEAVAKGRV